MLKTLSFLAIGLGIALFTGGRAQAQVSVNIGEPPVCPYGYYEVPPYNCAPDGYTGRSGFQEACSSVRDRGSMGPSTSMDMWIII